MVYVRRTSVSRLELKKFEIYAYGGDRRITAWGCFSNSGIGKITTIDGIVDSKKYTRIHDSCLVESADLMYLPGFIFQQDIHPKNSSAFTKEYFSDKK